MKVFVKHHPILRWWQIYFNNCLNKTFKQNVMNRIDNQCGNISHHLVDSKNLAKSYFVSSIVWRVFCSCWLVKKSISWCCQPSFAYSNWKFWWFTFEMWRILSNLIFILGLQQQLIVLRILKCIAMFLNSNSKIV